MPHFETQLRPVRFAPTKQEQQRQQQIYQLFCSTDPPPLPSQIFHGWKGGGWGIFIKRFSSAKRARAILLSSVSFALCSLGNYHKKSQQNLLLVFFFSIIYILRQC